MCGEARDKQDVPAPIRFHPLHVGTGKGGQGKNVEMQHGLEPFQTVLLETFIEAEAGIVDQDRRTNLLSVQRSKQFGHASRFGKVTGLDDDWNSISVADPAGHVFQRSTSLGREDEGIALAPPGRSLTRHPARRRLQLRVGYLIAYTLPHAATPAAREI